MPGGVFILINPAGEETWQGFLMEVLNMLGDYTKLKNELIEKINTLESLNTLHTNSKIFDTLRDIKEKLIENRFHLVVLGQFKRGKSTFINSLIGDPILPTSVVPLTSIVTILKYAESEQIEVIYQDGKRKTITRDEIKDYVTEKGNPGNEKGVKQVEIGFPSDYLKDGVYLIDTPGVGSTFENNTEVTYNYLPNVDAGVFLLSVDPPISKSEIEFLKDVRQYVEKIFFIQNKIDYLSEDEQAESISFSKQVIEDALEQRGINIYPLSAKMALEGKTKGDKKKLKESKLEEFVKVMDDFLMNAKGRLVLRSAINSIKKTISDMEFAYQLEIKALSTPIKNLETKINLFKEKMEIIKQDREDIKYYFDGEINRVIDILDRDLERLKEREIPKLIKELEDAGKSEESKSISDYVKYMESVIHNGIIRTFEEWIIHEEERLNKEYARVSKNFSEKTNEIIDTIIKASEELFDIHIERFKTEEAISGDSSLYYMLGEPPRFFDIEGAFDFFSKKILPRKFSRRMVLKDLKKKLPQLVDKNCGRVRWDFMDRIRRSFMEFRWDINLKIDTTEQSIRNAIEQALNLKKESSDKSGQALTEMNNLLNKVKEMKKAILLLEKRMNNI